MSVLALTIAVTSSGACSRPRGPGTSTSSSAILRIGLGQNSATNPIIGLRQLSQNLTVESLARTGEDGRMQPSLAEGWKTDNGGRDLTIKLRSNVKFHDGSPADAAASANILVTTLQSFMGPIYSDVDFVRATGPDAVTIRFKSGSPFLAESLEAPFQKPGKTPVSTGPYVVAPDSKNDLLSNPQYYAGRPSIDHIQVETFATVRAAWAEMLRDRIDMLYEIGPDAFESMKNSTSVAVFTFVRRYQYVVVLNNHSAAMRSPEVRRGLSLALDRSAIVKNALNSYGVPSAGPIWPRYWAVQSTRPQFEYDPVAAAQLLGLNASTAKKARMRFTCLVPPDAANERIALEVKRQFETLGVEMVVEEATQDEIVRRTTEQQYDAALIELISGPTMFRVYLVWHSTGPLNWAAFGNRSVDAALDRVRAAPSEGDYREAVEGVQDAFMKDPPAIFLAWSVRGRAVSKRFTVPTAEPGRDILSTLRLWKPASDARQQASRN